MINRIYTYIIGCFILCLSFQPNINAQTNYGEDFKSRLYVGGTFGLGIGTVTNIDLSPMVGYNFNDYLSGGVGATYMFYSYNQPGQDVRTSFYGGRLFLRSVPLPETLPGLYLHAEIENINNLRYIANPITGLYNLRRAWTPAILIGPGFRQQAGANSYFTIGLYFNVLDNGTAESSIYNGPIIYRIGFIFGLY
jgi:hypothetical protein